MFTVLDVSRWQGRIDWDTVKASGRVHGVMLRALGSRSGTPYIDPMFETNYSACTRLGIPFGTYLYSYATTVEEARSEADHVARLLGLTAPPQEGLDDYTAAPYQLSYPVYYDLEDKYISGVFPSEMAEITKAFFDRLQEHGYTFWTKARSTMRRAAPWTSPTRSSA